MSQLLVYLGAVCITALIQGLGPLGLLFTLQLYLSGFLVAFALQTETFYDILGGLNFLALAVWSVWDGTADTRKIYTTILFSCSRQGISDGLLEDRQRTCIMYYLYV